MADNIVKLRLHYRESSRELNVDPEEYSFVVLLSDFTKEFHADADAWQSMSLSVTCEVPGKSTRLKIDSDKTLFEVFQLHGNKDYVNVYLYDPNDAGNIDDQDMNGNMECIMNRESDKLGLNINVESVNLQRGVRRQIRGPGDVMVEISEEAITHNPFLSGPVVKPKATRKKKITRKVKFACIRRSARVVNCMVPNGEVSTAANGEGLCERVESSDDELYVMSDDDDMHIDKDDDMLNKYTDYEIHAGDDSDGGLSHYDSTEDFSNGDESDNDYEKDPLKGCINKDAFKIPVGEKFKLQEGMLFLDVYAYRKTLYEYSIMWGFVPWKIKNDRTRVTACCNNDNCNWRVHASVMPDMVTFVVKTSNPDHTCMINTKLTATAKWIAEKIKEMVRVDRNVKLELLKIELKKFGVNPTNMQLYRAKKIALEFIEGSHSESYKLVPKYCRMVLLTNPGSVAMINYDMPVDGLVPFVKRVFIGFEALKNGFLNGCKPFIGFDGCFLKGPYGGVLLSAVALEGDNGIFPIAFVVVESECEESWGFFFEQLENLMNGFGIDREWTFMTDRQKGLVEVVKKKVPHAIHRKCGHHILSNFRALYPGLLLRKLFWKACKAYTSVEFHQIMRTIKAHKPQAHDYLMAITTQVWARHAFSQTLKCNHVTNNHSESFNSWIGDLREKPILTMMEEIRGKLMNKLHTRYANATQWTNTMTPMVISKLQLAAQEARQMRYWNANETIYEVKDIDNVTFLVDIERTHCDCGVWSHTGIPCTHATLVLLDKRHNLEDYCDMRLSKYNYISAYSFLINPIQHISFWPEFEPSEVQDVIPPLLRRRSGRPRSARRRGVGGKAATLKRSNTL